MFLSGTLQRAGVGVDFAFKVLSVCVYMFYAHLHIRVHIRTYDS